MTITHEVEIKHINLYPPTKTLLKLENIHWVEEELNSEIIQPILTIAQAMGLKENNRDKLINFPIPNPDFSDHLEGQSSPEIDVIVEHNFQDHSTIAKLDSSLLSVFLAKSTTEGGRKVIEIFPGKTLIINSALTYEQEN